jgi:PAS domain S-box-containing protein
MSFGLLKSSEPDFDATPLRKVDGREWWLWAFAIVVTLVLTCGIVSLTFPAIPGKNDSYFRAIREWTRGLAALVLLFDIYTVYQHLQIQRIRTHVARRDRLFHLIAENAADMIAVVDTAGRRLYNSPAYEKILGYTSEELASTTSLEQVHPDDRARVEQAARKARSTGCGDRIEYRIRHKHGSWRILESTASALRGNCGEVQYLVIVNRDITDRKRAEALLQHRAFYDALTHLPNRELLLDRLQRSVAVARHHNDYKFALLFIDVDNFQVVNDSLGHAAGDELLIGIARRLTACLRVNDTVSRGQGIDPVKGSADNTLARPGGDEFIVLAAELHAPSDAVRIAKRIQERFSRPFELCNHEIVITASIGIFFSDGANVDPEGMLRDAEIAMYRAKNRAKGGYEVFDPTMQIAAIKRLQLESDLRKGLQAQEFRVYYQPIVALNSHRIVGFEALTRWERAQQILPPSEFLGVANELGLIIPMNRELLRQACQQVRQWQSIFPADPPLSLSVNIASKELEQLDLASHVREILQQTDMDPRCVQFEITETIAMEDVDRSARVLQDLKGLGVGLSIDDFGTGFSSLWRLQHFPVNTVKMDRSFLSGAGESGEGEEIVRIIITLAHTLGLNVIAEGVEKPGQVEMLKNLGCEFAQGFLFSAPVDADAIEPLLSKGLPPLLALGLSAG